MERLYTKIITNHLNCYNQMIFLSGPRQVGKTTLALASETVYLWDWAEIEDIGAKTENFIASHLLKAIHFWTDYGFGHCELYFIRDKEKREVDFLVTKNKKPWFLVEAKHSNNSRLSKHLERFQKQTAAAHAFQVILDMPFVNQDCFKYHSPIIVPAKTFLSQLV